MKRRKEGITRVDLDFALKVSFNSDKFSTYEERVAIFNKLYTQHAHIQIAISDVDVSNVCKKVPCLFVGAREDMGACADDIEAFADKVGGDFLLVEGRKTK